MVTGLMRGPVRLLPFWSSISALSALSVVGYFVVKSKGRVLKPILQIKLAPSFSSI